MEKWALTIGYSRERNRMAGLDETGYEMFVSMAVDFGEALLELQKKNHFLGKGYPFP